jgi:hypothetical protein
VTAIVEPVLAAGKDELYLLYQGRSPKAGWREVLYYGPATVEVTQREAATRLTRLSPTKLYSVARNARERCLTRLEPSEPENKVRTQYYPKARTAGTCPDTLKGSVTRLYGTH